MDETLITNIEIYSADSYGRGVGRHEGKVLFIPYAAPGDIVDCRIIRHEENFDIAALVNIVESSPHRETPPCPYFGVCPGCAYQHISYELELKLKGKRIAECLSKFGGTDAGEVYVTPSPEIYGYRNHVTLHLWYNGLEAGCGLIDSPRRRVLPIEKCLLLPEFARDLSGRVSAKCKELAGSYKGRFALRLPFILDHQSGNAMLIPGRSPVLKMRRMMRIVLEALQDEYPPSPVLMRVIEARTFRFSPLSFTQANEYLMPTLYQRAKSVFNAGPHVRTLDMFSGVGALGIICAGGGGLTFIERSPTAVEDLRYNVEANGITDAVILEGDVEALIDAVISKTDFDWVILNPPRKGLPRKIPESLNSSGVRNLLYVSCNPATLGRDIGRLAGGGFRVSSVEGVDMFPRTPHIETVALIQRD